MMRAIAFARIRAGRVGGMRKRDRHSASADDGIPVSTTLAPARRHLKGSSGTTEGAPKIRWIKAQK
jgi:hypothetical protein